jgi:hypothetical protein
MISKIIIIKVGRKKDVQGTSKAKMLSILPSAERQLVKNNLNIKVYFFPSLKHKLERQILHCLLMCTEFLP